MIERQLQIERHARYFALGPEDAPEVWIILHGYGQLAAHFLRRFRRLDDGTRRIVAPEALSRFYLSGTSGAVGASWMTRIEREAEIADILRYLDAVWDEVASGNGSDRQRPRLVVFGFSQGAASAARWSLSGRSGADRLILWGGFVPPDVSFPGARPELDLVIVVGDHDEYVDRERLEEERRRLHELGLSTDWVAYGGGHEIDVDVLDRLARRERPGRPGEKPPSPFERPVSPPK